MAKTSSNRVGLSRCIREADHVSRRMLQLGWPGLVVVLAWSIGCRPSGESATSLPTTVEADAPASRPVTVTVAAVEIRPVARHIAVVGTLHGFEHFTISPKVEGLVKAIYFDVADRVPPGSVLL